jgi:hypothetical protein
MVGHIALSSNLEDILARQPTKCNQPYEGAEFCHRVFVREPLQAFGVGVKVDRKRLEFAKLVDRSRSTLNEGRLPLRVHGSSGEARQRESCRERVLHGIMRAVKNDQ